MKTLFSLRFHQSPETRALTESHKAVAGWLTEWGTLFLDHVVWKAFGPITPEQHVFQLDFVILPERGRDPFQHVLVEIIEDDPSLLFTTRDIARRNLLRELWPGTMLSLDARDIRQHPDIVQLRLLNALS